jgi:hypothetical protein
MPKRIRFFHLSMALLVYWYLWPIVPFGEELRGGVLGRAAVCVEYLAQAPGVAQPEVCDGHLEAVRSKQNILQL